MYISCYRGVCHARQSDGFPVPFGIVSVKVPILLANSKWCNFNTMTFRRVALLFPLASQGQVGYSHPPITQLTHDVPRPRLLEVCHVHAPIDRVPDQTRRVARAAFPKGNPYLTLRDQLGASFRMTTLRTSTRHRSSPACRRGAWRSCSSATSERFALASTGSIGGLDLTD